MRCWQILVVGFGLGLFQLALARTPLDQSGDPLPAGALLRLGSVRFHPPSAVSELALSPDGKIIISVGDELMAWDTTTGKALWRADPGKLDFRFRGTGYGVGELAFTADSARFYTPGGQNKVLVWNTTSGAHEALTINLPKPKLATQINNVTSVDVTADGQHFAVGCYSCLAICGSRGELFSVNQNGPRKIDNNDRLMFNSPYSYGRFSPDGKFLALVMSGRPERLRLCDVPTGRELKRIDLGAKLVRLAFSPDGTQIAATERDNAVRLYDAASGERLWSHVIKLTNPFENYTSAIAFSPDGKTIAAGATDHRIYLLDPATGEQVERLVGHTWYPWALAFSTDSKLLYSSGWDGAIRRWDVASRKQLELPVGVRGSAIVAASPRGDLLANVDGSEKIWLVDSRTGAALRTIELPGTSYSDLTFSPNGKYLAGGGSSGDDVHVAVWNVENGDLVHRWNWPKGNDPHSTAESLCFSPDGRRLAANVFRQSAAYLWDLTSGRQTAELAHNDVHGLSFSPDGKTLATAGWDSMVRFWQAETGKLHREVSVAEAGQLAGELRMYAVQYLPDSGLIATAHLDGTVRIWQADEMLLRTQWSLPHRFLFGAMKASPDGLWLSTGDMTGHVNVWDPLTGTRVWDRGRHQGSVYTLSFGRDNQTLVSGGSHEDVCYLWDLQPDEHDTESDMEQLWQSLAGEDSIAAYRAMWALARQPQRSVPLFAAKLRPVSSVIDVNRVNKEDPPEERQRLKQLKKLLAEKDPRIELQVVVRRAMSVLVQIGTDEAQNLLQELAERNPTSDVGKLAAAALERAQR